MKKIKEMEDEIARLEEGNLLDICYILDKMNTFDQSLKEHDVKGIIKYIGVYLSLSEINLICGIVVSALTSSAVDRGFKPQRGPSNN